MDNSLEKGENEQIRIVSPFVVAFTILLLFSNNLFSLFMPGTVFENGFHVFTFHFLTNGLVFIAAFTAFGVLMQKYFLYFSPAFGAKKHAMDAFAMVFLTTIVANVGLNLFTKQSMDANAAAMSIGLVYSVFFYSLDKYSVKFPTQFETFTKRMIAHVGLDLICALRQSVLSVLFHLVLSVSMKDGSILQVIKSIAGHVMMHFYLLSSYSIAYICLTRPNVPDKFWMKCGQVQGTFEYNFEQYPFVNNVIQKKSIAPLYEKMVQTWMDRYKAVSDVLDHLDHRTVTSAFYQESGNGMNEYAISRGLLQLSNLPTFHPTQSMEIIQSSQKWYHLLHKCTAVIDATKCKLLLIVKIHDMQPLMVKSSPFHLFANMHLSNVHPLIIHYLYYGNPSLHKKYKSHIYNLRTNKNNPIVYGNLQVSTIYHV